MPIGTGALQQLFVRVDGLRVGIVGDFCLDVYWHADMQKSVLSRETPHFPLPVVRERMQPGAAGNVACNFAALKPAQVRAITVLGKDWRGLELKALLQGSGVDVSGVMEAEERTTNAYIKPMRKGITDVVYEDPRLDFENHRPLPESLEEALLDGLNQATQALDVLYVCDQLSYGCITERVRERLCELGRQGLAVWVDSRERVALYRDVICKPNDVELCAALGIPPTGEEEAIGEGAKCLQAMTGKPLMVTLGAKGALALEGGRLQRVVAYPVEPPLDICGAGDTFGAAASLLFAAGATMGEAAAYAACSASLTVQKLAMTGTTTREELLERVSTAPKLLEE